MADQIRVNGAQMSWGSIVARIDGTELHGFTDISFGDSLTTEKARGLGKHQAPRGRSRGEYDCENAKLTGFTTSMQALRAQLAQKAGGQSYGQVEFDLVVQYIEDNEDPVTVQLYGCRWEKNGAQHSSGNGVLKEDAEFSVMAIRRNGLALFDTSEATPY